MRRLRIRQQYIRVELTLYDSTYNPSLVELSDVSQAILVFMEKVEPETIDLGSMMIVYDKKIYY